jgi:CRISPR/Cas system CSM-associated protein Csm3 (group 7 of RAMP superfamily)
MPQDEQFWNPYRMVPAKEITARRAPWTREKERGKSGVLYCTLENLTLLFIGGNRHNKEAFLTRNGLPVIPGSSLKGMLRSLAETVGGGCHITDPKGVHSPKVKACEDADNLCVACRMFGMMERTSHARVHTGNVSVGDALIREREVHTGLFKVLLGSPAPRHSSFYINPANGSNDGRCRKFYFHQPGRTDSVPEIPANLQHREEHIRNIRAILPGHHFDFEIYFTNLEEDELSLLIYAVALEPHDEVMLLGGRGNRLRGPLRHKIGHGKPLGLGSCRIDIQKICYAAAPVERYRTLRGKADRVLTGDDLATEVLGRTRPFAEDTSVTMQQLRKMLVWDETDRRSFHYPTYHWFKNPANSTKPLKPI